MLDLLHRAKTFLTELRRRHVYRVGAVYLAVAFVLLEGVDLLEAPLGLPPVLMRILAVVALFGFPLAVVLAWAFEVTPDGVVRTESLPATSRSQGPSGRRYRVLLSLAILVLATGVALLTWVWHGTGAAATEPTSATIAVLAFRPLGDGTTDLARGITRSTRDRLSVIDGIEVIGGASSDASPFASMSAPAIARALGADYLLTATVQRSPGDAGIEVLPDLFGANGTQIRFWDGRPIYVDASDLSLVEARIAEDVTHALDLTVGEATRANLTQPRSSPAAYEAYLRGMSQRGRRREARMREAVALDSTFALAHAKLASQAFLRFLSDPSPADSAQLRDGAAAAIRYAPRLYEGYMAMGLFHRTVTLDNDSALSYLNRALALAPGNAEVRHFRASVLWSAGMLDSALVEARRGAGLDRLSASAVSRVSRILLWKGRLDEAWELHLEARPLALESGERFVLADGASILAAKGLPDSARALTSHIRDPEKRLAAAAYILGTLQSWLVDDSLVYRLCPLENTGRNLGKSAAGRVHCARAWAERGEEDPAREIARAALPELRALVEERPGHGWFRMRLAWAHLLAGDTAVALAQADSSLASLDRFWDYWPGAMTAVAYVQLAARAGNPRRTVRQLERMLDGASPISPAWVRTDPAFDPIRTDSGFREIMGNASAGGR